MPLVAWQQNCSNCHNETCLICSDGFSCLQSLHFEAKPRAMVNSEKANEDIDFSMFLNIGLNRAMRRLQSSFFNQCLAPQDLSIQEWRALLNLAKFGDCHVRELARLARIDPSHLAKAVSPLEARGLVCSSSDEQDGRRKRLAATQTGHELVALVWQDALKFDQLVQNRLGKKQYQQLKLAVAAIQELEDTDLLLEEFTEAAE